MLPLFQTAGISPSVLHREWMAAVFTLSVAAGYSFYVQRDECYNSLLNSSADGKIFLYASGNSLLL